MSSTRGCWFQSMNTCIPFAPSSHLMGSLNHRCMLISNCLLMHTGIKKNTKVTLKDCTLPAPQKKTFAFLSSRETRPPLYIQVFVSYTHLAKMLTTYHMLLSPLKRSLHFPLFILYSYYTISRQPSSPGGGSHQKQVSYSLPAVMMPCHC
jgi:hypothetical protein